MIDTLTAKMSYHGANKDCPGVQNEGWTHCHGHVEPKSEKLYTPMGDAETRMQIVPLEELLAERDEIVSQLARLRAVYSNGGTFDALRKIELSKAANLVRAQATLENKRVTESYLDEMAHVADAYVDFIVRATSERADWVRLEERLAGIDFTINRGQAVAKFVTAELGLQPR